MAQDRSRYLVFYSFKLISLAFGSVNVAFLVYQLKSGAALITETIVDFTAVSVSQFLVIDVFI